MPQVFKVWSYWVFFWANENDPLEPVHVHVCQGAPNGNATKIWITKAGGCILCNNNSRIPDRILRNIMDFKFSIRGFGKYPHWKNRAFRLTTEMLYSGDNLKSVYFQEACMAAQLA